AVVPHVIERIATGNGKLLYSRNEQPLGRIIEARYEAMMNEMMQQTLIIVTAVWLGNDDGTPTKKVTGGGLPVEIWSRFMRGAHQGAPVAALPGPPAGGMLSGLF